MAPSDPILLLRRTRTSRCGSSLPVSGVSAANVQYTSKGLREGGERTRDEGKRERERDRGRRKDQEQDMQNEERQGHAPSREEKHIYNPERRERQTAVDVPSTAVRQNVKKK